MSSTEQTDAFGVGYIARQIETAVRLFRVNPAAVESFDTTADGFFRSFLAVLIAVPFMAYHYVVNARFQLEFASAEMIAPPEIPSLTIGFGLLKFLQYVLQWVALPVALGMFARPLGLMHRYVPFVVAYNWATLVALLLVTVPMLLFGLGLADLKLAGFLIFAVTGFSLYYSWSVAVSALQVPPLIGVAVVAADFLFSACIFVVFEVIEKQLFTS